MLAVAPPVMLTLIVSPMSADRIRTSDVKIAAAST